MGTRSTVKFFDTESETPVASIYQQFDGYISGVGYGLANFLKSKTIVNGYNMDHENGEYANGMGCLAAQYIAKIKTGIGGVYMTTPDDIQAYNYEVRQVDDEIIIKVVDPVDDIFEGTPDELLLLEN